jgi:mannosyltransferase
VRTLIAGATTRWGVVLGLLALAAVSLLVRTGNLDTGFWIDEGLSVGIADRPLLEIPGVLRQDGSPPLYYMLLHVWMAAAGDSEVATHWLSLCFALLSVPAAWWALRAPYGPRAAWIAATLAALNPFLTSYAQETRMYSLVVLLGLLACGAFLRALVMRRPRWSPALGVALAALLYTHNWALFFVAACGVSWLGLVALAGEEDRRDVLRAGLVAFGLTALLYLPWVPTMLFQAAQTGAPWALRPPLTALPQVFERLLGSMVQFVLLLSAGAGLLAVLRARRRGAHGAEGAREWSVEARGVVALIGIELATMLIAWLSSQVSPAWALRYLAVGVAPLLALAAIGLSRAGGLGLAGLAIVALLWAFDGPPPEKSNVREVSEDVAPALRPGDLVVSTQPEQIPVLDFYLPDGLDYATVWGPVADVGVTDWRDGVDRLRETSAEHDLAPLIDRLAPGRRLVLITPIFYDRAAWSAPWTELVRFRSIEWRRYAGNDPRLGLAAVFPPTSYPARPNPVRATVFVRVPRD